MERICDCNMPQCMDCFMVYYRTLEEAGCCDKEQAWEGIGIQEANAIDEEIEIGLRPDQYPNGDGW